MQNAEIPGQRAVRLQGEVIYLDPMLLPSKNWDKYTYIYIYTYVYIYTHVCIWGWARRSITIVGGITIHEPTGCPGVCQTDLRESWAWGFFLHITCPWLLDIIPLAGFKWHVQKNPVDFESNSRRKEHFDCGKTKSAKVDFRSQDGFNVRKTHRFSSFTKGWVGSLAWFPRSYNSWIDHHQSTLVFLFGIQYWTKVHIIGMCVMIYTLVN